MSLSHAREMFHEMFAANPFGWLVGLSVVFSVEICLLVYMCKHWPKRRKPVEVDWTQNLDIVEINVPLPEGAGSRDVTCRFSTNHLFVSIKGMQPSPAFDSKLQRAILPDECNWQLWPVAPVKPGVQRQVKITLVKAKESIWPGLLYDQDEKGKVS